MSKIIKKGQIYKLRRDIETNTKNYKHKKDLYDPYNELSPYSFYVIVDLIYNDSGIVVFLRVSDSETNYTEVVDVYRIYGNYDEKKFFRIKKLKIILEDLE